MTTALTILGTAVGFLGGIVIGRRNHRRQVRVDLLTTTIPDLLTDMHSLGTWVGRNAFGNPGRVSSLSSRLQWNALVLTRRERSSLDADSLDALRDLIVRYSLEPLDPSEAAAQSRQQTYDAALAAVKSFREILGRKVAGRRATLPR